LIKFCFVYVLPLSMFIWRRTSSEAAAMLPVWLALTAANYLGIICIAVALNEANTEPPGSSRISSEDMRVIKAVKGNPQSRLTLTRGPMGTMETISLKKHYGRWMRVC
jgi:hypothetical protein